jgi:integrase
MFISGALAEAEHCQSEALQRSAGFVGWCNFRGEIVWRDAHKVGYTPFNAGAVIKVRSDSAHRGANLAKRIITETEVALLIRAAPSKRDRVMVETAYAGGLRVSEIVALAWADVLPRDERVQLSIAGKGGKVRQVLLRSSAVRCCRCAETPAPMIRYSPAGKAAPGLPSTPSTPW